MASRSTLLLLLLAAPGCDGGSAPADAAPDGGHADSDVDADADADADGGHPACAPGEALCFEGAVRECGEDGLSSELARDCAEPPWESCIVGSCGALEEPDGPCCVATEPFCRAEAEVEGKDRLEVDYLGLWDEEFACAGSIAEDGYNWSLWARIPSCEGPFVRVVLSGYLEGWEPGSTYPLCRTWETVPDVRVVLTADRLSYGNDDPGATPAEDCEHVSGTVTFHEYGGAAGEPYRIAIDGVLLEPGSGETRALRVESSGLLLLYPS